MPLTHEIIRQWCESMGYPPPKTGDCTALLVLLSAKGDTMQSRVDAALDEAAATLPRIPSEAC